MILTTEVRASKESHSGSAPPQPFNRSKTENHHRTEGGLSLNSFIGMLTMSDFSPLVRRMKRRRPTRSKSLRVSLCDRKVLHGEVGAPRQGYRVNRPLQPNLSFL